MKTPAELAARREAAKAKLSPPDRPRVLVGMATCGLAAGAGPVYDTLKEELGDAVILTGCVGVCRFEPLVEVIMPGKPKVTYVSMTPEKAKRVVAEHIKGGAPVAEYEIGEDGEAFFAGQFRVALRNCGVINPEDIDEYIAADGYEALAGALSGRSPADIISTVLNSGLRGRGGAGFPTGRKWQFAKDAPGDEKYIVCNADEGDPGAFMDRSVLEGDPHSVLEAMALAGYAVGSSQGYIYVRAEYPTAVARLNTAIAQAKELRLLGQSIMGSSFSFDLEIRLGAGAFVCGEETALLTSIEGNRGEPRPRPPFPAVKGLFGKPTLLNNVETYANIPWLLTKGADALNSVGTATSKGTKVFALGGKITGTGLVEVPMGTTLREVIEVIGGGCPGGKRFKAAQTGGPSGGCIPASHIDTPIDYESLSAIGSMMGSGGLIVMDEDNCMVDIAKYFLDFTVDESCGKCSPCRIGTKRLYQLLEKITHGRGTERDLELLEELCGHLQQNSLCALGQTAPNPVLSTLRHFRDEYVAHVRDKKCPAHVCKSLVSYSIIPSACKGCTLCARVCPAGAITGAPKEPHVINSQECIKCGACFDKCKFSAIVKE